MKKIIITLAFLLAYFFFFAQSHQLENEIRTLEVMEYTAMLKRDTVALKILWASDFIANTPANRITLSRQELFDLIKAGIFNFSSFTRTIEKVILKDCIAITMGSETVVPVGNTPRKGQTIVRRYTNIWIKQDDTWRLAARHANEICTQ